MMKKEARDGEKLHPSSGSPLTMNVKFESEDHKNDRQCSILTQREASNELQNPILALEK